MSVVVAAGAFVHTDDGLLQMKTKQMEFWLDGSSAIEGDGIGNRYMLSPGYLKLVSGSGGFISMGSVDDGDVVQILQVADKTAGTLLRLMDINNGNLYRVEIGANDSAGAGYRTLRIANS